MGNKEKIETLDLEVPKAEVFDENVANEEISLDGDLVSAEEKNSDHGELFIDNDSNMFGSDLADLESNIDSGSLEEAKGKKSFFKVIIVIGILLFACLVVAFCVWNNVHNKKLKDAMKMASLDYFDKYMSANTGASAYKVTLADLKNANNGGESYDLGSLKDCDEEKTFATISIDYSTGRVSKTEIRLNCKKF